MDLETRLRSNPEILDCTIVTRECAGCSGRVLYVVPAGSAEPRLLRRWIDARVTGDVEAVALVSHIPRVTGGAAEDTVDEAALASIALFTPRLLADHEANLGGRFRVELAAARPAPRRLHLRDLDPSWRAAAGYQLPAGSQPPTGDPVAGTTGPPAISDGGELVLGEHDPRTLTDALLRAAQWFPNSGVRVMREAGPDAFVGYPALLERAGRICTGLREAGLRAGDRVILQVPDLADHFPALWACLLGGIQPATVAVPPTYTEPHPVLEKLYQAWLALDRPPVVTDRAGAEHLRAAGVGGRFGGVRVLALEQAERAGSPGEPYPARPEDTAVLQLSSGSTGAPKVIPITHRGIVGYSVGARERVPVGSGDTLLNWLPLDHVAGLLLYHFGGVYVGADNVHVPTDLVLADPLLWLELMDHHRVTHSWAPNFGFQMVADALRAAPDRTFDLSAVRALICGGEQIRLSTVRGFLEATAPFGITPRAFVPSWGMAETCTAIVFTNAADPGCVQRVRTTSLPGELELLGEDADPAEYTVFFSEGWPAPGAALRIVDRTNRVLPERRIGRLQVRSARVTPGYLNDPRANAELFGADGWFTTGDLAYMVDGQVVMTGREKDLIVVRGNNVFCHEVEAAAGEAAGVQLVAACGVPDARSAGESLVVFVTLDPAARLSTVDIVRGVRQAVAARLHLAPDLVVPVAAAEFPRTTSGKVQRGLLREWLAAGRFDFAVAELDLAEGNDRTVPDCVHRTAWVPAPPARPATTPEPVLVCAQGAAGAGLAEAVAARYDVAARVEWTDALTDERAWDDVLAGLPVAKGGPRTVLYLVGYQPPPVSPAAAGRDVRACGAGLLALLRAYVARYGRPPARLVTVSRQLHRIIGDETVCYPAAFTAGLTAEAAAHWPDQWPDTQAWHLDLPGDQDDPAVLLDALRQRPAGTETAWRAGRAMVRQVVPVRPRAEGRAVGGVILRFAEKPAMDRAVHKGRSWVDVEPRRWDAMTAHALTAMELLADRPHAHLVGLGSPAGHDPVGDRFLQAVCDHAAEARDTHCLTWHGHGMVLADRENRRLARAVLAGPAGQYVLGVDTTAPGAWSWIREPAPRALEVPVLVPCADDLDAAEPPPLELRDLTGQLVACELRPADASDPVRGRATGAPVVVRTGLVEQIRSVLADVLGGKPVDDRPFHEQGMGSVELVQARARLQRQLGRPLPPTALYHYPTVGALAGFLAGDRAEPVPDAPVPDGSADRRIAVVGMAVRFPDADTPEQFWDNLAAGVTSVRQFDREELATAGVSDAVSGRPGFVAASAVLGDVDGFDAEFFGITPAEAALIDPQHRLFLECCHHTLEHGGYAGAAPDRIGVYAGAGMNLYTHQTYLRNNLDRLVGSADPVTGMQVAIGNQPDFVATRVAYRLGLRGPAINVYTACSTALVAVHLACQALLCDEADLALAGAAAIHVPQVTGYQYTEGSILSRTGRCRAFDAGADGTVGGNGVAAVLLKRLDRALADGDTVHAVLLGSAVNNDGATKAGFTAPSVTGQVEAISRALRVAGVPAQSVGYVEAHATGTALGDPIEIQALTTAFRAHTDRTGYCALGSVKANIGHLDSCAGMAGLLKTVLALRHGHIPPQPNFDTPNPALDLANGPFTISAAGRPWPRGTTPRRAGVSALGVGGTNAHVVVEEAPPGNPAAPRQAGGLLPLSAHSPAALTELAGRYRDHLRAHPDQGPADLLLTAGAGRRALRHRLVAFGDSANELADALDAHLRGAPAPVLCGEATGTGPLGFAFAGQGTLRAGVAGELYERFPAFRAVLDRAERGHAQTWGTSLLSPLLKRSDVDELAADDVAQPALLACSVAMAELWRSLGVHPDYVIGHSAGEYAALCVAGAQPLDDAVHLAALRGRLMRELAPRGAMLAVFAERATVDAALAAVAGLELAVVNGPDHHVLAGAPEAVDALAGWLGGHGLTWRPVPVGRAFHSTLLDPVLEPLRTRAGRLGFTALATPLASTVDATVRPVGWRPDADYVRDQTRRTCQFGDALSAVAALAGAGSVLDVGPGRALSGTGGAGSPGTTGLVWVPGPPHGDSALRTFLRSVATLYCRGANVDWTALAPDGRRVPLPYYPFQHRPHRIDATPAAAALPDSAVPDGAVLAEIRAITARHLGVPVEQVGADDEFVGLGADSLLMINMMRDVEHSFAVRVTMRELFDRAGTPRRLGVVICERNGVPMKPAAEEAGPNPAPVPPDSAAPVSAAAAMSDAMVATIEQQLRVMSRLTDLMSQQLAAVSTGIPTDISAAVPAQVQRSPVPAPAPPPPRVTERPPAPSPAQYTERVRHSGRVEFGMYFFGDYPPDTEDKYEVVLDAARFADEHGFSALWLPERHFHSFGGIFPNPSVLAAALARETRRIRLNAGSVVLPLHHPVRVAEEWSVVDNLSGGRVGLCCASGWHANDFAFCPENYGRHKEVMYQHLDTVRQLWRGATVPATSGTGAPIEVRLFPRPVQPMPPLYTAIVGNPDSYRRAAEHDLGVVTNLMTQDVTRLAENIGIYREARAERGLDPGRVVVLLHTYLAAEADRARAEAFEPFCGYLRSSMTLLGQVTNSLGMNIDYENTPEDDLRFMLERAYERYCESRALIGSPETCAPVVDALVGAGVDEIACFVDFGLPSDAVRRGLPFADALRRQYDEPTASLAVPHTVPRAGDDPVELRAPLSPVQQRLWVLHQLFPGRSTYNEAGATLLDGPLDVPALRAALRMVAARHMPLRTVFREEGTEPVQVVLREPDVALPVVDRTGQPERDVLDQAMRAESDRVYDLPRGPLFAPSLWRISPTRHLLVVAAHHLVLDALSVAVLSRELSTCYGAVLSGLEPDLPLLPVNYPDYSRDQRTATAEQARRELPFWTGTLAGLPTLRLPTDRPRPAARGGAARVLFDRFDAALSEQVHAHARRHRATPFMVLLTAFAGTLRRYTGQDDIVVGTPIANRPAGTENLIGFFVNSATLRLDLTGDPTFTELLDRVRASTLAAVDHHELPFDEVVRALAPRRDTSRNPLFDVLVEYQGSAVLDLDLPGVRASSLDGGPDKAPFDLSLYLATLYDGIRCQIEYDPDLFEAASVRRVLGHFRELLAAGLAEPHHALSRLSPLSTEDELELARLRGDPAAWHVPVHRLVEQQAARTPDAPALSGAAGELTYRELNERANRLAWLLRGRGVGTDDLVALCLPRGPGQVSAMLAVLKAGAAYLPLDPAVVDRRLRVMLDDGTPRFLVTTGDVLAAHPLLNAGPVLRLDKLESELDGCAGTDPPGEVPGTSLAYCLYTSGSTGRPKGVAMPHRALANLVGWHLANHEPMVTLQYASCGFDVCAEEVFTTLAAGGRLVLVADEVRYDPAALVQVLRRTGVRRLFIPYTPLKYLAESLAEGTLPALREIISAGEALRMTPALLRFLARHPDCRLHNEYGPTETHVVTAQPVRSEAEPVPIGRPVAGTGIQLLDADLRPVPPGAVGEICVSGVGLARGYHARPAWTAEAFRPDPVTPGARLYRTGDLARLRPDGTLQFCGRRDDQVKIRGYRVEPAEVERAVAALPAVRDAAVLARQDGDEPYLVGYVVPAGHGARGDRTLRAALERELATVLPDHMIPRAWAFLPSLPINANGKLDRARLPAPDRAAGEAASPPSSPAELALHPLWCAELGTDRIGIDDSFFDLGGHSLSATRLINKVRSELGASVPVLDFFRRPTIRAMAIHVEHAPRVTAPVDEQRVRGTL